MHRAQKFLIFMLLYVGVGVVAFSQSPSGAYNSPAIGGAGGSNTQIQYNNNGILAGSANLTTNPGGFPSLAVTGVGGSGTTMTVTAASSGQLTALLVTGSNGNNLPVIDVVQGGTSPAFGVRSYSYGTTTNCSVNSASPAACGGAAAGSFVVPTTTTAYTVNTTAIHAASRIFLFPHTDTRDLPGAPTCVVPAITAEPVVSGIVAATSFSITIASTTGQTCWDYLVMN